MSHSLSNKQRVFLAYRPLFKGENAQLRKAKSIKKLVEKHKDESAAFIKSLGGVGNVVTILKPLLTEQVFSSEAKAKETFPSLFKTSVQQDERHSAAEASTAKKEAEALVNVEEMDQGNQDEQSQPVNGVDDVLDALEEKSVPEPENATVLADGGMAMKSIYPSYVPFRTQHLVLTSAQRLLEECCFEFTAKWSPSLIEQYNWDCPEAIELNKWTLVILKRFGKLPMEAFNYTPGLSIREVLISVNPLRHSAVHRLHTSAKGIDQMIQSAAIFANALRDADRASQLEQLHAELESKIRAQELNKNFLEEKLVAELDEIQEIRRALDEREQKAIDTLYREDNENKSLVGSMLEDSVREIFGLPGSSNGHAARQDESADEADIDNFPVNGAHNGNNHNAIDESLKAGGSDIVGEQLSPLPADPVEEECPPEIEDCAPIEEPWPMEAPAPEEQICPEEPPADETQAPVDEPEIAEETAPEAEPEAETEAEPEPILEAAAEEDPMEEKPAEIDELPTEEPAAEAEPAPEDPWSDFYKSGEDNDGPGQELVSDAEPEKCGVDPEPDAAKDDIQHYLEQLIDPIIEASGMCSLGISKKKDPQKKGKDTASYIRVKLLKALSENISNNKFELYDLISKSVDM